MKLNDFLKDKLLQIILLIFTIATIEIFLLAYKVDNFIMIYISLSTIEAYFIGILIEYYKKKKFYENIRIIQTTNNTI